MTEAELAIVRRAYALQITAAAQTANPRLADAFASVRREDFLGAGPWPILPFGGDYLDSPSADPVYLYSDDLVGIDTRRRLNNGRPSFHARLLSAAAPASGEHVVHIGAGVGYYSAVMARMVAPGGRVTAVEVDAALARRAAANLAGEPGVTVMTGDGATAAFDDADVIYANAGTARPADAWLDRLKEGGRLVLLLTTDNNFQADSAEPSLIQRRGAVFLVTRRGDGFAARWISAVAVFPSPSLRDPASEQALARAFSAGGWERVTRLHRGTALSPERCWLQAPGWCLAYD